MRPRTTAAQPASPAGKPTEDPTEDRDRMCATPLAAHGSTRLARALAVFGPGLLVMLADTDVGSVITAGQSGVRWGYRLLALQLVLVPILYVVQELTVRLGIFSGRGHGELIR